MILQTRVIYFVSVKKRFITMYNYYHGVSECHVAVWLVRPSIQACVSSLYLNQTERQQQRYKRLIYIFVCVLTAERGVNLWCSESSYLCTACSTVCSQYKVCSNCSAQGNGYVPTFPISMECVSLGSWGRLGAVCLSVCLTKEQQ